MDEKKLREYMARADITDQRKIAIVRLAAEMGVRLDAVDGMADGGTVVTDPMRPKRAMEIVRALAELPDPMGYKDDETCLFCQKNWAHSSVCLWIQALMWADK